MIFIWGWRGQDFRYLFYLIFLRRLTFDSMSHDLLMHKLRFKFGLSSAACRLFGSFLGPRTQKVMINGECSVGCSCDLQRILDWSRDNSLTLNASKTQTLLVS
jgi:hypothetical protein